MLVVLCFIFVIMSTIVNLIFITGVSGFCCPKGALALSYCFDGETYMYPEVSRWEVEKWGIYPEFELSYFIGFFWRLLNWQKDGSMCVHLVDPLLTLVRNLEIRPIFFRNGFQKYLV